MPSFALVSRDTKSTMQGVAFHLLQELCIPTLTRDHWYRLKPAWKNSEPTLLKHYNHGSAAQPNFCEPGGKNLWCFSPSGYKLHFTYATQTVINSDTFSLSYKKISTLSKSEIRWHLKWVQQHSTQNLLFQAVKQSMHCCKSLLSCCQAKYTNTPLCKRSATSTQYLRARSEWTSVSTTEKQCVTHLTHSQTRIHSSTH